MITLAKKMQHLVDRIVIKSPSTNKEELARLNHYVWITFLMIPTGIISGLYNIYVMNYLLSFCIILFATFLIVSLFLIQKTEKTSLLYYGATIIFTLLLFYLVYHPDNDHSLILWVYTYPLGIIFLLGNRHGFLWSMLLLGMIGGLFLFSSEIQSNYPLPFQVRFTVSYLAISFITSWIEYHRARFQKESMQSHHALSLEQKHLKEEIQRRIVLEKKLQRLAQIDPLTGLFNRGYFLEIAEREFLRAVRYNTSLCFALLDIDNFKQINDTQGHPIGDKVIQTLAQYCQKSLRESDVVGRLGGEEFAILLLHVNHEEAKLKMQTLKEELSLLSIPYQEEQTLHFTVSIGVAMLDSQIANLDELYIQADIKLYKAKEAGRNCVVA